MQQILLIMSERHHRMVLSSVLRQAGFCTTAVSTAVDGLAAAEEQLPDVVLVEAPQLLVHGVGLLQHLQSRPSTRDISVAAMVTAAAIVPGPTEHCDAYIVADDPQDLCDQIAELLDSRPNAQMLSLRRRRVLRSDPDLLLALLSEREQQLAAIKRQRDQLSAQVGTLLTECDQLTKGNSPPVHSGLETDLTESLCETVRLWLELRQSTHQLHAERSKLSALQHSGMPN